MPDGERHTGLFRAKVRELFGAIKQRLARNPCTIRFATCVRALRTQYAQALNAFTQPRTIMHEDSYAHSTNAAITPPDKHPDSNSEQNYSQDDIEKILARALAFRGNRDSITHSQLVEVARELGLSDSDLERAIEIERTERPLQEAMQEIMQENKREVYTHFAIFGLVNPPLFYFTAQLTGEWWVAAIALAGWTAGFVGHAWSNLFPAKSTLIKAAEKLLRKREGKTLGRQITNLVSGEIRRLQEKRDSK